MSESSKILLYVDSGAYSAFTRGNPIDLDEWIEFCKKLKRKKPDAKYVNLDIIGKPGEDTGEASFANWMKMREAGLDPLPVYHAYAHPKWLKKYLTLTDYIGIGAIADMSTTRRLESLDRLHEDYLIDRVTRLPKCRTHGMGLTSFPLMRRYSWFSVDSTSWLQAGMYGKIFIPHLTGNKWDYTRKPYQMDVSTLSPRKEIRQRHIFNLTPHLRKILDRYISENGFVLGKSEIVDGKEKILEVGLASDYAQRCHINSLYFIRFLGTMSWPRPLERASGGGGLFETRHDAHDAEEVAARLDDGLGMSQTRMYFSGEIPVENYMRDHPELYPAAGVMLTYYMLRNSESNRTARRLRGLIKNRKYKEGPKRAKAEKVLS